jgi:hypothetical protein
MESEKKCRYVVASMNLLQREIRLFGQMFERAYGYFDDRSGSEKLTQ